MQREGESSCVREGHSTPAVTNVAHNSLILFASEHFRPATRSAECAGKQNSFHFRRPGLFILGLFFVVAAAAVGREGNLFGAKQSGCIIVKKRTNEILGSKFLENRHSWMEKNVHFRTPITGRRMGGRKFRSQTGTEHLKQSSKKERTAKNRS